LATPGGFPLIHKGQTDSDVVLLLSVNGGRGEAALDVKLEMAAEIALVDEVDEALCA
jgi:hypothetical protein